MGLNNKDKSIESESTFCEPLELELENYSQANAFFFKLPGFRQFKTVYEKDFHTEVRKLLKDFDNSKFIHKEIKDKIRLKVAKSIAQIVAYQVWEGIWDDLFSNISALIFCISFIFVLVSTPIWFWSERGIFGSFAVTILAIIAFFIYCLILFLFENRLNYLGYWAFLIISIILVGYRIQFEVDWFPQIIEDGLTAGLIGGLVFLGGFMLTFLLYMLAFSLEERKRIYRHPEDEILETLCYTLAKIEGDPDHWRCKSFKRNIVESLEWISRIIECQFYLSLSNGIDTKTCLRLYTREMAADIRNLKDTVLLPQEGSREHIMNELANRLVNAAEGNWGLFQRSKPLVVYSRGINILNILCIAFVLVLPILVIIALEEVPYDLSDATRGSIITATIGSVLFSLVAWIEPKHQEKALNLQNLSELLSRVSSIRR